MQMTQNEIYKQGLAALRERLGVNGMIRFLQQLQAPTGDYTFDRRLWMDHLSLDDIKTLLREQRAKTEKSRKRRKTASARSSTKG